MDAVSQLSFTVGIEPACAALGVARGSYYRQRPLLGPSPLAQFPVECLARPMSARALCAEERQAVRNRAERRAFPGLLACRRQRHLAG
jgi:hypothetical protein